MCSLTKIYTDLCECCARPKGLCKRVETEAGATNGGDILSNRFLFLDVGDVGEGSDRADNRQIDRTKNRNLDKEEFSTGSTPRLVDDTLEEVFGLWKDIQVSYYMLCYSRSSNLMSYRRRASK